MIFLCPDITFQLFLDPYVKLVLRHNGEKVGKKRKTNAKKQTLNPEFNETFVFEFPFPEEEWKDIELEFILLDNDRITKDQVCNT